MSCILYIITYTHIVIFCNDTNKNILDNYIFNHNMEKSDYNNE